MMHFHKTSRRIRNLTCGEARSDFYYHAGMGKQLEGIIQYTIRGIPTDVDRALRLKATQRKQSLNRVVLDELSRVVMGGTAKTDFSDLVGKWTSDAGFDEIVASERKIDIAKWE